MDTALFVGSVFGAFVGIVHACAIFRTLRARTKNPKRNQHRVKVPTFYYVVWTVALWVLFGSYVLYLWAAASVVYFSRAMLRHCQLGSR